jgi:hypothetical protein
MLAVVVEDIKNAVASVVKCNTVMVAVVVEDIIEVVPVVV